MFFLQEEIFAKKRTNIPKYLFLQLKVETDIKLFWILQKCKSTKSISLFWLNFKLWWKCAFVNLVIYSFSNYSTYYYSSSYKINDMICVVFYNNPLDKVVFTEIFKGLFAKFRYFMRRCMGPPRVRK